MSANLKIINFLLQGTMLTKPVGAPASSINFINSKYIFFKLRVKWGWGGGPGGGGCTDKNVRCVQIIGGLECRLYK